MWCTSELGSYYHPLGRFSLSDWIELVCVMMLWVTVHILQPLRFIARKKPSLKLRKQSLLRSAVFSKMGSELTFVIKKKPASNETGFFEI